MDAMSALSVPASALETAGKQDEVRAAAKQAVGCPAVHLSLGGDCTEKKTQPALTSCVFHGHTMTRPLMCVCVALCRSFGSREL